LIELEPPKITEKVDHLIFMSVKFPLCSSCNLKHFRNTKKLIILQKVLNIVQIDDEVFKASKKILIKKPKN